MQKIKIDPAGFDYVYLSFPNYGQKVRLDTEEALCLRAMLHEWFDDPNSGAYTIGGIEN